MKKISIIAPMYNEVENIERTITEIKSEISRNPQWDYEIIFVNDGSTDNTWEKAKELALKDNKIKVFGYPTNQGRGKAIRLGFENASGDFIVTIDFDLSYDVTHITKMVKTLEENPLADVVLASVYMPGGKAIGVQKLRLLLSKLGNQFFRYAFTPRIHTSTCIVRAYRKHVLDDVLLESNDKVIHLEIISKILALGYKIVEIPAVLTRRKSGKSKFKFKATSLSHLIFLIQERPFLVFGYIGILLLVFGIISGTILIYSRFSGNQEFLKTIIGRLASPNIVIILFISGIQMLAFGFLGIQNTLLKKELFKIQKLIKGNK